jgi:hypothetical protein
MISICSFLRRRLPFQAIDMRLMTSAGYAACGKLVRLVATSTNYHEYMVFTAWSLG